MLASIAVAASFEVRSGTSAMPRWTWPLGIALAAGFALSSAATAANPFFEGVVRIQREVGHRTIDAGPYHRIRHPGYAGLVRTALEDATLRRELPGYAEYARRVKQRLMPGLW